MKKIVVMCCLVVIFLLGLTGCQTVVKTEYREAPVLIVGAYHDAGGLRIIPTGKTNMYIRDSEEYIVEVEFNKVKFKLEDKDNYDKYKNKIGSKTTGIIELKHLDDGDINFKVVGLKGDD